MYDEETITAMDLGKDDVFEDVHTFTLALCSFETYVFRALTIESVKRTSFIYIQRVRCSSAGTSIVTTTTTTNTDKKPKLK